MSDERTDDDAVAGEQPDAGAARPTGKRRRGGVAVAEPSSKGSLDKAADDKPAGNKPVGKKGAGKKASGKGAAKRDNAIKRLIKFLREVIAELRKVIWPNRKQMIGYTTVVLVFLVFMVALIGGVDFGLAKLVMWVFG